MARHEFFKFQTRNRSALTGGLLSHVSGKDRPEKYVTKRNNMEAVVDLLGDSAKRTAEAVAYVEATKRHHKAAPCVELLVAGPPPYEPDPDWDVSGPEYHEWKADSEAWGRDREREWADANVCFLQAVLPDARIYQAAFHQDENSPHTHILFVPSDDSDQISWRQLSAAAVGEKPPAGLADAVQRARIMSAWQDLYHAEVGEKFRLERGERGSTRKHEPLTDKKRRNAVEKRRIAQARAEILARLEAEKEARVEDVRRLEAEKGKEIEEIRNAAYRLGVMAARTSADQGVEPPEGPENATAWLEHLAARRRIQSQLEIADLELNEAGKILEVTLLEDPADLVDAEKVKAWAGRVATLTEALETNDFSAVEAFADDERMPGYSAKGWARKVKGLEKERLQTEMDDAELDPDPEDLHDAHYELGGDANPEAEASDDLSSGMSQEEKPE